MSGLEVDRLIAAIRWVGIAFIIGCMILALLGCAHQDEWTRRDTVRQIGVTTVMLADAITTTRIQYTPDVYEGGPMARLFVGTQPSSSDTYQYFFSVMVTSYFISRALPARWRPYWQTWEMGVHVYAVRNNCQNGLC